MSTDPMIISVVIPTYKRSNDLRRCLDALIKQEHLPYEVILVIRPDDAESHAVFQNYLTRQLPFLLKVAATVTPGVVQALNQGINAASGQILAITDDDAAPRPHWLKNIHSYFISDPKIGGVGGRDCVFGDDSLGIPTNRVGRLTWYGKPIGNHHRGAGPANSVHFLKGANSSWRREAIGALRFDERLKGSGAQVHHELGFGLSIIGAGWKIIYDPEILVDHYPAVRHDEDKRNSFNQTAFFNAAFNEKFSIYPFIQGPKKVVFLIYSLLIGHKAAPGIFRALFSLKGTTVSIAVKKLVLAWRALFLAIQENAKA